MKNWALTETLVGQKKGKLICCFYAAGKGEIPWLQNVSIRSWHWEINNAKYLIASKVTRSKKYDLNSIDALPLDKGDSSTTGEQKQPRSNNDELLCGNNYEKGTMDFHDNLPKASINSSISSSDAASTLGYPTIIPQCHTGIQMKQESFLQQEMVRLYCNQLTIQLRFCKSEPTPYLEVISTNGAQEDVKAILSKLQEHIIHQQCQLLCLSLWFAKENMTKWTRQQCCSASIKGGLQTGLDATKNSEMLMRWYRQFRVT
jgi:hypothetical protein